MLSNSEITAWLQHAERTGLFAAIKHGKIVTANPEFQNLVYPFSVTPIGKTNFALLRTGMGDVLGIFDARKEYVHAFEGIRRNKDLYCPLTHKNAKTLRLMLPFTAPSRFGSVKASFGTGDRLGLATPGHIRVFQKHPIFPVFAQQSVREITLTGRSFHDVLDSVTWSVFGEGFREPWGADGDHLKNEENVQEVIQCGYTMVTADVSDYIHEEYTEKPLHEIKEAYRKRSFDFRERMEKKYLNDSFKLASGTLIRFSEEALVRIILMYYDSLQHAKRLYNAGSPIAGEKGLDFELSIDETRITTTPHAHLFIARELTEDGIPLFSIAPRFPGDFQKAIDYRGDIDEFERALEIHNNIARTFHYKLSIHSGSDKFTIYPIIGRVTKGSFHVKTAGTNWLEALKIVAQYDREFFSELYAEACKRFSHARKYYHVSPDMSALPDVSVVLKEAISILFENDAFRQVLHITYGEIFSSSSLKHNLYRILRAHLHDYWDVLESHIGKHVEMIYVL
jgi:hypothetical protein